MKRSRVENAVDVINYAIKNRISVKEASVKCGFSDTYVKNIKADINSKLEKSSELYRMFDEPYQEYCKLMGHSEDIPTDKNVTNLHRVVNEELSKKPKDLPQISSGEKTTMTFKAGDGEIEWTSGANYPADHIKTLDELLKITEVDLNIWKVKDYLINKWDVTSWKNNLPETIQNFQVKARLERLEENFKYKCAGDIFLEMIKDYQPPVLNVLPVIHDDMPSKYVPLVTEENLLEISIFDLHIGKLAWAGETYENYDVKIAHDRFLTSIETLLYRARSFNYKRILFPVGNDFFNSDNLNNTTTKGTPQDEDLRWQKTFKVGVRLLVDAINLLKQTGVPVDVLVIPGNHDFERTYYMGLYLEAWFNNDEMVHVNNGASPRKYYKFGKVLLGFTHGSEEKESSLPLLMATDIESKPMWSETTFHEWHIGHIHRKRKMDYTILDKHKSLNEDLGVTVRYLSSLTGTEEWHHKRGFVGQIKAADAFIWNDKTGLIANLVSNITT